MLLQSREIYSLLAIPCFLHLASVSQGWVVLMDAFSLSLVGRDPAILNKKTPTQNHHHQIKINQKVGYWYCLWMTKVMKFLHTKLRLLLTRAKDVSNGQRLRIFFTSEIISPNQQVPCSPLPISSTFIKMKISPLDASWYLQHNASNYFQFQLIRCMLLTSRAHSTQALYSNCSIVKETTAEPPPSQNQHSIRVAHDSSMCPLTYYSRLVASHKVLAFSLLETQKQIAAVEVCPVMMIAALLGFSQSSFETLLPPSAKRKTVSVISPRWHKIWVAPPHTTYGPLM